MQRELLVQKINDLGRRGSPFLFVIDFEMKKPFVSPIETISPNDILYCLNGYANSEEKRIGKIHFVKDALPLPDYQKKFDLVYSDLKQGNSYLTNLTVRTKVQLSTQTLRDLFHLSKAPYKLFFKDEFIVFSPESFIRIVENKIYSYPMKGTIDADEPNAMEKIINDPKEMAEHTTIVDLLRNDLSVVASNVKVSRFRYVEEIRTNQKNLLQVSSEISGDLPDNYRSHLGDIIVSMLPAGSVSGAPKKATCKIIRHAEGEDRGYYTGVFGIFDGLKLDSGVMIRFIEKSPDGFYYRSGGGITAMSELQKEYQEVIDKVYVPVT